MRTGSMQKELETTYMEFKHLDDESETQSEDDNDEEEANDTPTGLIPIKEQTKKAQNHEEIITVEDNDEDKHTQ